MLISVLSYAAIFLFSFMLGFLFMNLLDYRARQQREALLSLVPSKPLGGDPERAIRRVRMGSVKDMTDEGMPKN